MANKYLSRLPKFNPTAFVQSVQQTGATYTLLITDAGKVVRRSHGSAATTTIPAFADVPFEVGAIITIRNYGAGDQTIEVSEGTLEGINFVIEQGQSCQVRMLGEDSWEIY